MTHRIPAAPTGRHRRNFEVRKYLEGKIRPGFVARSVGEAMSLCETCWLMKTTKKSFSISLQDVWKKMILVLRTCISSEKTLSSSKKLWWSCSIFKPALKNLNPVLRIYQQLRENFFAFGRSWMSFKESYEKLQTSSRWSYGAKWRKKNVDTVRANFFQRTGGVVKVKRGEKNESIGGFRANLHAWVF